MTWEEAVKEMEKGEKVTHTLFRDHEWLMIHDRGYLTEDGCVHNVFEWWKYHKGPQWRENWSVWQPKES